MIKTKNKENTKFIKIRTSTKNNSEVYVNPEHIMYVEKRLNENITSKESYSYNIVYDIINNSGYLHKQNITSAQYNQLINNLTNKNIE